MYGMRACAEIEYMSGAFSDCCNVLWEMGKASFVECRCRVCYWAVCSECLWLGRPEADCVQLGVRRCCVSYILLDGVFHGAWGVDFPGAWGALTAEGASPEKYVSMEYRRWL
jgi:hypothetical protein